MAQAWAYLLVFVGAGLGGVLRFALGGWMRPYVPATGFWWPTLLINVLASALLGWVMGRADWGLITQHQKLFLGVGLCGGFSTFSAFGWEAWHLVQQQQYVQAIGYALASVLGTVLACGLGWWLGRP